MRVQRKYFQVSIAASQLVVRWFWWMQDQFQVPWTTLTQTSTEDGIEISISKDADLQWQVVLEATLVLLEDIPYRITLESEAVRGFGM